MTQLNLSNLNPVSGTFNGKLQISESEFVDVTGTISFTFSSVAPADDTPVIPEEPEPTNNPVNSDEHSNPDIPEVVDIPPRDPNARGNEDIPETVVVEVVPEDETEEVIPPRIEIIEPVEEIIELPRPRN